MDSVFANMPLLDEEMQEDGRNLNKTSPLTA